MRTETRLRTSRVRMTMLLAAASLALAAPALACDLCAIYTGSLMQADKTGLLLGVGQQYTSFDDIRAGDHEAANPAGEWLRSSTTQLLVGYAFTPRIGAQLNLPLISREYRRVEGGMPVRGDLGGVGDLSIVGRASPLSRAFGSVLLHAEVLAGVKIPTGDSEELREEMPMEDDEPPMSVSRTGSSMETGHEHHQTAVHGHALALGSGSVDGLFGASMHASWKRLFAEVSLQYAVRGNGDFSYEAADDVQWEAATGVYVLADHDRTASASFVTSGEDKGKDRRHGDSVDDTAITAVYVGPGMAVTWSDALHANLAVDLPVLQDVSGRQIVADYRLRAGMVWRF